MGSHWRRELTKFRTFTAEYEAVNYRDWQPAKWQSLSRLADDLVDTYLPANGAAPTALELGCGSATLLTQLAMRGVDATGIDRDPDALQLAKESGVGLGSDRVPDFRLGDFDDPATTATLEPADLVLHIGVIEHFDVPAQLEFLRLSARLSRRWILVGIPNLASPVFRSFLATVRRDDEEYEDEHLPIDVPALADRLGYRIELTDGCHVFLGQQHLYNPGDAELDEFYAGLGERLVQTGGGGYAAFPNLDFRAEDIEVLRRVESACSVAERLRFGFLNFYLLDCAS